MYPKKNSSKPTETPKVKPVGVRLNKFLANAGLVGNRRLADELIKNGLISINGKVVSEMGYKVAWNDKVFYEGRRIYPGEKVFVLINKPKGFVGTNREVEGKRTLLDLVRNASESNLYVVDYMATDALGLVLLTNDGHFAKTLGQGNKPVQQLFKVQLSRELTEADMETIKKGFKVDDQILNVTSIAYTDETKKIIGLELYSPIKLVVAKLFKLMNYPVISIDRVIFAGLTKKNLARGQWRFLTDREVLQLRSFI